MNSPITKTLIMVVMAAVTSAAAAFYYPWPEVVKKSALVGSPLFEAYDSTNVRSIQVVKYDDDASNLDQIRLERNGEKWVVPSKRKYIADNTAQISLAANSLSECIVLEERTDLQQDYLEYGVVDPSDFANTPNKSALGSKIILEDRDRKELASLIVGKPLKDGLKHFARIPGQPTVYVVEFNPRAINTDFKSWVNPNLFQLSRQMPIARIVIEDYKIDQKSLTTAKQQTKYLATLKPGQDQLDLAEIQQGDGKGGWQNAEMTAEMSQQFQVIGSQLGAIQFPEVFLKSKQVVDALRSPKQGLSDEIFKSLNLYGFVSKGFKNGMFDFDASGGELHVASADGVVITLYRGAVSSQSSDIRAVSNYVMFTANVDESILPSPKKPVANDNAEEADKQEKAYLRMVKARDTAIKSAKLRASAFNQQHAKWIYVVSEEVTEKLIPEISLAKLKSDADSESPNQTRLADDDAKTDDDAKKADDAPINADQDKKQ